MKKKQIPPVNLIELGLKKAILDYLPCAGMESHITGPIIVIGPNTLSYEGKEYTMEEFDKTFNIYTHSGGNNVHNIFFHQGKSIASLWENHLNNSGAKTYKNHKPSKGYVYFVTNPGFKDNCVKIGFTYDWKKRIKSLSKENVPDKFEPIAIMETTNPRKLEELVHNTLDVQGLHKNKEFYDIPHEAISPLVDYFIKLNRYDAKLVL